MIGTLIGLVQMLRNLESPESIGSRLSSKMWGASIFSTSHYESISHVSSLSWGRWSVVEPWSRHFAANAAKIKCFIDK